MLGLVTNDKLLELTDTIIEKNVEKAMKVIDDIVFAGRDIYNFIKDLISHMRNLMMIKISQNPEEVLDMSLENIQTLKEQAQRIRIEELMRNIRILQETEEQSKWSKQSRIYLELAVIKLCKIEYDTSKEVLLARINKLEEAIRYGQLTVTSDAPVQKIAKKPEQPRKPQETSAEEVHEYNADSSLNFDSVRKAWRDILEMVKSRRLMVLYASLITGELVGCANGIVEIKFEELYGFNKKRLEQDENRKLIEEIFSQALKEKVRIKYIVDKKQEVGKSPEEIIKETFGEELVEIIDE
jgi:DNA polymerase-3 subunit gamma/tau